MSSQLSEEAIAKISVELALAQALVALEALNGRGAAIAKTHVETALLWVQHKIVIAPPGDTLVSELDSWKRRVHRELLAHPARKENE